MLLTCPQCQSQYSLETSKLGASGRVVRCVSCSHTWFQAPEVPAAAPAPPPQPTPVPPAAPIAQAAPPPPQPAQQPAPAATDTDKDSQIFEAILSGVGSRVEPEPSLRQEISTNVITHNPFGVGAAAFGGLTFFLCVSLTLLVVFLGQKPIIKRWPQMTLLYKAFKLHPKAPGEGLRISEVVAEKKMENQKRILVVSGKMTNMSEHVIAYPPLHVSLKDDHMKVVKEWDIKAGMSKISSGDVAPMALQLDDVPAEGTQIEMRVLDN